MEKCKECIYKTTDHYCSHEQFIDSEGHMAPARYVWFVGNNKDTVKNYCAGKYFKHVNGTVPNA